MKLQQWAFPYQNWSQLISFNVRLLPVLDTNYQIVKTFVWQRRISFPRNCKAITWLLLASISAIFSASLVPKYPCLNGIWINIFFALCGNRKSCSYMHGTEVRACWTSARKCLQSTLNQLSRILGGHFVSFGIRMWIFGARRTSFEIDCCAI